MSYIIPGHNHIPIKETEQQYDGIGIKAVSDKQILDGFAFRQFYKDRKYAQQNHQKKTKHPDSFISQIKIIYVPDIADCNRYNQ